MIGAAGLCLALGCSGLARPSGAASYFERPRREDPWSRKIARWQARERAQEAAGFAEPSATTVAAGPDAPESAARGELRAKYLSFRTSQQRTLARELAVWLQEQSREHYLPDGPLDRWATLEETLARNGDDCDGLELLAYHLLLDLGFRRSEVYRAIVLRPADGQHHMVTLWFEDPHDPWVLDPTGAMTAGMPRMSAVPGWIALKLFSESEEFTVRTSAEARDRAAAVPVPPLGSSPR